MSIYLPTHRVERDTRQDSLRLKNLLRDGANSLRGLGLRSSEVRAILEPGRRLLELGTFWQYQSDGLALFLGSDGLRSFRLPLPFQELVQAGARFHVKPLIPYVAAGGRFFLLALSQNELRLFEGSRYAIDAVDIDTIPESLADALRYDDPEPKRLLHIAGRGGPGARAIFHGHGIGGEIAKDRILRYFRQIDSGLRQVLRDERAPLVLAGVQYLFGIYREANSYRYLVDEGISGNPDELRPEELHARAVELLEPGFRDLVDADGARYRELAGTGLTSTEVPDVLAAGTTGRVEVLFVALDQHRWGTFDPASGELATHEARAPGDEDLLDRAASEALITGAAVHALPTPELPDASPLAAIYRF